MKKNNELEWTKTSKNKQNQQEQGSNNRTK